MRERPKRKILAEDLASAAGANRKERNGGPLYISVDLGEKVIMCRLGPVTLRTRCPIRIHHYL